MLRRTPLQINQTISLANGIFSLSSVNLSISRVSGIQAIGIADFVGLPMNAQINIFSQTNLTTNTSSAKVLVGLKAADTGLADTVTDPRMWPAAPNLVVQKLRSIKFPALDITSNNGTYKGVAGPLGGVKLSFALDTHGLRYIRLDTDESSCLSLGSLVNDMGIGLNVPDDVFSLCRPFVQFVPAYQGLPGFNMDNGTTITPSATVGFVLTISALGLRNVAARLDYTTAGSTGQTIPSSSMSIQLSGPFSFLDGFATVYQMSFFGLSRTGCMANVTLSIPELNMEKANALLLYTSESKTFSLEVIGRATIFSDSVVLQTVNITVNHQNSTLQGSASGLLGQYSASTSFTYVMAGPGNTANAGTLQDVSIMVPTVNMGNALRTIGPHTTKMLPNVLLTTDLPSMTLSKRGSSTSGIYQVVAGPTNDGIFTDVTLDQEGVLIGTVKMRQPYDISKALNQLAPSIRLGASINDVVIIYNPIITVVSNRAAAILGSSRGTLLAPGTYFDASLSVPPLMGDKMFPTFMRILDGDGNFISDFRISWQGEYSPITHVTITGASLTVKSGTGLVGTATGKVVGVDVTLEIAVASAEAKAQGASALSFTATFRNMILSDVMARLFPSTPQFVLDILRNARFSELVLSYNGGQLGVNGSPDISNVPALRDILGFLGFTSSDIRIKPGAAGALMINIEKTWDLYLGDPFVGTSKLAFQLGMSMEGSSTKLACGADFMAGMRFSFLDPEVVNFNLGATVSYDSMAPPPGVSFLLKANVTSRLAFKDFGFMYIESIGGTIGIQPQPLAITYMMFSVRATFIGTKVSAWLLYDQAQKDFAFTFSIEDFSLQNILDALGVRVNLGPLASRIRYAFVSMSKREINFKPPPAISQQQTIPAGFFMAGNMTMLSLEFAFRTAVDSDGVEFEVEARDVTRATIFGQACAAAQKVLDALRIDFKIIDVFNVKRIKIGLVLRKSRIGLTFAVDMTLLGLNLNIDIALALEDPWTSIVNRLKDKLLEPLTAACTKNTYGRGVGTVLDTCASGYEKQGALCYPNCPTDWQYGSYGRLSICYQNCPPGYRDDFEGVGLTCSRVGCSEGSHLSGLMCYENCRPGYYYFGGVCYEDCTPGQTDIGALCSEWYCNPGDDDNGAGMCYPACRPGYSSNGLTMCIENTCPPDHQNHPLTCYRGFDTYGKGCCCTIFGCCNRQCSPGFSDDGGCMCTKWASIIWKKTYDRGTGYSKLRLRAKKSYVPRQWSAIQSFSKRTSTRGAYPLQCASDKEQNVALCYPYCNTGYKGVGPVCWQTSCPPGLTDCGTYCAPSAAGSCANFVGAIWQDCVGKYGLQSRTATTTTTVGSSTGGVGYGDYDYYDYSGLKCDVQHPDDSPGCFCYNRDAGIYPNPVNGPSGYIICALNVTYVHQCGDGLVYNPDRKACDLPPAPPPVVYMQPNCTDRPDGHYVVDPSDLSTAYKCMGGEVDRDVCGPGLVLDTSSGACRPAQPITPPSGPQPPRSSSSPPSQVPAEGSDNGGNHLQHPRQPETPPPPPPPPLEASCKNVSCFCKEKPDGKYPDVLGMNMFRYIQCKGGRGRSMACPPLLMFDNRIHDCNDAPRNGTQLLPNCQELGCFCVGRPDGAFQSPFAAGAGIRCASQYGYEIKCPNGFKFIVNRRPFCQSSDDDVAAHPLKAAEDGGGY